MESVSQKLKRNLKEGTFFKNVPVAVRNRLVKKFHTSNMFYLFDKHRVETKKYQDDIELLGEHGYQVGNYYLDDRIKLDSKSIIYSLGILTDISFDTALASKFNAVINMYDPTPKSIAFMEAHSSNELLNFNPYGVWIEDCTLKFYEPKLGGSASLMDNSKTEKFFEAECLTMKSIMSKNKHENISVFKADIEGAALPILDQMVKQSIFPDQIVVEFERPRNDEAKIQQFFEDLSQLREQLKNKDYLEFLLPRKEAKYFSLEMLFVKKTKLNHGGN